MLYNANSENIGWVSFELRKKRASNGTVVNHIQDVQLSQRDGAAGCVIVLAKNGRLELRDNILRTI